MTAPGGPDTGLEIMGVIDQLTGQGLVLLRWDDQEASAPLDVARAYALRMLSVVERGEVLGALFAELAESGADVSTVAALVARVADRLEPGPIPPRG